MTVASLLPVFAAALALTACQQPAADEAFGQKVRAYLLEHPEVIREAVEKLGEKERLAALKASTEGLKTYRAQLERDPRDFVANPGGKITVVEFFDYRCSYCKVAAPDVAALIRDNPDIRFVFKELPIFGSVSDTAARVAVSAPAKAKGLALYTAMMADKALTDAAIDRHLKAAGVDPAAARAAAASPEVAKHIEDTRVLAKALQIEGTPAFVVGDVIIPGADMPALKAAIATARSGKT